MKDRVLKINPQINVITHQVFYDHSKNDTLILNSYNYIIDAIDSVKSKLDLIENAILKNIPIISSMGARE